MIDNIDFSEFTYASKHNMTLRIKQYLLDFNNFGDTGIVFIIFRNTTKGTYLIEYFETTRQAWHLYRLIRYSIKNNK